MQATVCRWTILPMSRAEQDNKIRAVISTLVDLAPGSAFEGKLAVQMLGNHEVIVDCQSRSLNHHQATIHRETDLKHTYKAMEMYMKQMYALMELSRRRGIDIDMKGANQITADLASVQENEAVSNQEKGPRLLPDRSEEKAPRLGDLSASKELAYKPKKAGK